jgi:hypothetical protein
VNPRGVDRCPYPEGTCNFDAECPDGHCVGAMHTTDIPHVFACRGVCRPEWCDAFTQAPLVIRLSRKERQVVAHVTNTGCEPVYLQTPCGARWPLMSIRSDMGDSYGWAASDCSGPEISACTAEPSCDAMATNDSQEIPFPDLEDCLCRKEISAPYRATLAYFGNGACSGAPQAAHSNTLEPEACPD